MDIRFNAYNKYAGTGRIQSATVNEGKKASGNTESTAVNKTDVISISQNAYSASEISKTKGVVMANIDSLSSQEKIDSIKNAIAEGRYDVSSDKLASAILERFA